MARKFLIRKIRQSNEEWNQILASKIVIKMGFLRNQIDRSTSNQFDQKVKALKRLRIS